jgi:succinoglycan biosynthesis protein ExoM
MDHICIGICTYKRPEKLEFLLKKLNVQSTENRFSYSVNVVDNDEKKSAEGIVTSKGYNFEINYYNVIEKNIAKARNKVLETASGKYLAMIDDDEYPDDFWLLNHYTVCERYHADGTLGPVIAELPDQSPRWIRESNVCKRKSYITGTIIKPEKARTGNCLLLNENIVKNNCLFDTVFGLTGGEDVDFFHNLIKIKNSKILWCNEAIVYEPVEDSRLKRTFYIQRALKRGQNSQRFLKKNSTGFYQVYMVSNAMFKMSLLMLAFPMLFICNEKIRMAGLESYFHHLGRIIAVIKRNGTKRYINEQKDS